MLHKHVNECLKHNFNWFTTLKEFWKFARVEIYFENSPCSMPADKYVTSPRENTGKGI